MLVTSMIAVLMLASLTPAAQATPPEPDFGPIIDDYASYDGQSTCDPAAKPGVTAFMNMVLADQPSTGNYGISRNCNIGGTSEHKEGRAWDWRVYVGNPAADTILNWLLATDQWGNAHALARRLGVMYAIWNQQIWRAYRPWDGWQPYGGSNPHTDHVHFSFSWAGARSETTWWNPVSGDLEPQDGRRIHGDFTGDGRADLGVLYNYGNNHIRIWILRSNGSGFGAPELWHDSGPGAWVADKTRLVAGDFTGDGRDDLGVVYDYGASHTKVWVFPSNSAGNGFDPMLGYHDGGIGGRSLFTSRWMAGDLDADGDDDLIAFENKGNARVVIAAYINSGSNLGDPEIWHDSGSGNWDWNRSKVVTGEFTGDGRADIVTLYDYGNNHIRFWATRANTSGNGFLPNYLWFDSGPGNWDWNQTVLSAADVTGDGKTDLINMYDYLNWHQRFWVLPTNGAGTGYQWMRLWYDSGPGNWDPRQSRTVADDFSGDGFADVAIMYDYGNLHTRFWNLTTIGLGSLFDEVRLWYDSGPGNWRAEDSYTF